MNSNKTGNPGKIIKNVFVSTVGMVYEVRKLFKKFGTVTGCEAKN